MLAGLCALLVAMTLSARPAPAAAAAPVGWLTTSGSKILTGTGQPYTIKAVSWFGLETSNCAPHGLWQISLDAGLAQIASFGFNTIRLPFSNECLAASAPNSIRYDLNPDLVGKTPLQVMDAVVAKARAHGLSVILDRHRPDSGAQSALWYTAQYSEARWIDDWTMLAKRYRADPTVIGVDLHNEPHGNACWGCGAPERDWAAAATRAGNAVLAVNPKLLVVVEGVEAQAKGGSTWWGGGLADVAAHPVRLAVANRVVYSPHDYPSSIYAQSWFTAPDYPANLPAVWTRSWGYLQQQGIAPVLLGEFGTTLRTTSDQQWLAALVSYLRTNQMSFAYWSFNPNSGDTGGLVADDWVTPQRAKLDALRPILGPGGATPPPSPTTPSPTTPSPTTPAPSPTPSPSTPRPTPTPSPSSPSPTPTTSAGGLRAGWRVTSEWPGGYVAELTVTAERARSGWTVRWADPAASGVVNAWGMTCAAANGSVTCRGAGWAAEVPAGRSVTVGLQVQTTGAAPRSPRLTLG